MKRSRLLARVRARPDDDARRLAVAAAYESRDPARAAFIRAQLAGDEATARALLGEHEARWTAYIRAGSTYEWARGFVTRARIVTGDTLEYAKLIELVRAEPVVGDVTISIAGTSVYGMSKLPVLFGACLRWPLTRFIVRDGEFTRAEAYYEADSRGFMDHSWESVPAHEGPRLLAALEALRRPRRPLRDVGLRNAGLTAADLPRVLALDVFAGARSIDLSETPWGDDGAAVLAAMENAPERIILREVALGTAARGALVARFGDAIELDPRP